MRITYAILILAVAALGGCATVSPPEKAPKSEEQTAYEAMQGGDYRGAAREYSRLAALATGTERNEYQLLAVEAMLKGGLLARAIPVLDRLETAELTPYQRLRLQLLRGESILLQHDPERALAVLATPWSNEPDQRLNAAFHGLRAEAYSRLGNHLAAARELVLRERFLTTDEDLQRNHDSIWESLSLLPEEILEQALLTAHPRDPLTGWMELVRLAKNVRLSPEETSLRVSAWRERYPRHPGEDFLRGILERSQALMVQVQNIALLLPMTGRLDRAGAAVRDGILAAYYASAPSPDVRIRIYDTASNPNRVMTAYEQALRDGSDFVVGPLSKEEVEALLRRGEFPVPTLALNAVEGVTGPANFYQFSLSPEEEAQQVAERTWLEGFGRAAVLVPSGEWGERVRTAFVERWVLMGGNVVSVETYDPKQNDFSRPLMRMLRLDESNRRHRLLSDTLGQRIESTPRRRQDVDFVFLGALPRQARLIRPQLRFHHAAQIPVYATSHVFSGKFDPEQDRDMDGVTFGDMPWTLDSATANRGARRESQDALKTYDGQWQRLVALGFDAYNFIPLHKVLDQYRHERYEGETGTLRVDDANRVVRSLVWARFRGGIPRVIQERDARAGAD